MHAIPFELLEREAQAIGIELYCVYLAPNSDFQGYEAAMKKAVKHFKSLGVSHFIFEDIFLHDVRSYLEK